MTTVLKRHPQHVTALPREQHITGAGQLSPIGVGAPQHRRHPKVHPVDYVSSALHVNQQDDASIRACRFVVLDDGTGDRKLQASVRDAEVSVQ